MRDTYYHPYALTLTILLNSEHDRKAGDTESFDSPVYDVMEAAANLTDWSDEKRADLYARIEENYKPSDTLVNQQISIAKALVMNEACYG
jgi:hypothetical protein